MSQSKNFINAFPLTIFSDKIEINNNYRKKLVSLILEDEKNLKEKNRDDRYYKMEKILNFFKILL